MRCLICGEPDAACGDGRLEKPVFGEEVEPVKVQLPESDPKPDRDRTDVQVDD